MDADRYGSREVVGWFCGRRWVRLNEYWMKGCDGLRIVL